MSHALKNPKIGAGSEAAAAEFTVKTAAEYRELLTKLQDMPTLPVIAMKVNELIADPNATSTDIATILKQDQVLTAKILRLVNSSYYAVPGAPAADFDRRADHAEAAGDDAEDSATDYRYDEWDERRRAYRLDWCTLVERRPAPTVSAADAAACVARVVAARAREIRALRSVFARVAQRREWRGGQRDGADVDVDAVVDRHALLRAGHSPPEKLYLDRRRARSDLATLVLLDSSLSTHAHLGGESILAIMRDSVLVLGEAMAGVHDRFGVGAFASHSRRDCRFLVVKRFDEPWARARRRLPQLSSHGATRIGPALRHATFLLSRTPARRKLLLLISDGKPMDVDGYEGRHGIADVRQALREAARAGVDVFALTVDQQAREHLPLMFGARNYEILPDASQLARRLARVHHALLRL